MKTSTAFKNAKKHLSKTYDYWDQHDVERFICLALDRACDHKRIPKAAHAYCQSIVERRLGKCTTVESWLVKRGHLPENGFLQDHRLCQRIQDYRHAWVDALIAEFKAKGD